MKNPHFKIFNKFNLPKITLNNFYPYPYATSTREQVKEHLAKYFKYLRIKNLILIELDLSLIPNKNFIRFNNKKFKYLNVLKDSDNAECLHIKPDDNNKCNFSDVASQITREYPNKSRHLPKSFFAKGLKQLRGIQPERSKVSFALFPNIDTLELGISRILVDVIKWMSIRKIGLIGLRRAALDDDDLKNLLDRIDKIKDQEEDQIKIYHDLSHLIKYSKIKNLSFSYPSRTLQDISANIMFEMAVLRGSKITHLSISGCKVSIKNIKEFNKVLRACFNLVSLTLLGVYFTTGFQVGTDLLLALPLESFSLISCYGSNLQEITSLQQITSVFSKMNRLQSLDLSDTKIDHGETVLILAYLIECPQLIKLILGHNMVNGQCVPNLIRLMRKGDLEFLDLNGNEALSSIAMRNILLAVLESKLKELDLSEHKYVIDEQGRNDISTALDRVITEPSSLQKLNLFCSLKPPVARALELSSKKMAPNIRHVDIRGYTTSSEKISDGRLRYS